MDKLRKNYSLLASPLIVMALILAVFYKGGLYPFGNHSAAWCDMYQQVIPLLTDLKDILSGKQSIFFNLNNAGGMNFWGVFFFFIASPLSFLVVLFKKTEIVLMVNLLIVVKLGLSAFTSSLYMKRHFKGRLSQMMIVLLSASYGLCGYGMLYFQNNIWLDEMYLLPMLLLGFDILLEKRNIVPFTAVLAATVIVNYYISYMVIIFLLLLMGVFCYRYRKDDKYKYAATDLILSCILAAMASAVVWIPCFTQYLSSGRTTSLVHELANCNFLGSYQTTLSTIFPSTLAILIVMVCAFDSKQRTKKLNTYLILLFLTFVPLIVEPINKMWHTGSYMSFPSRYGFITVYMLIICAAGFLSDSTHFIEKPNEKSDRPFAFIVCAIVIYCFYMFFSGFVTNNYESLTQFTRGLWQSGDSFMLLFELFFVSVILQGIIFFLHKRGHISKNVFPIFVGVCLLIEGYTNTDIYMLSPSQRDQQASANQQAVMDLSDRIYDDESFYRVNTSKKLFDVNLVGAMGYNSLGHYTSLTDEDYMFMMKEMGYSSYWMEVGPYGGTELTDAIMNVKYRIEPLDQTSDTKKIYNNSKYQIVENQYYLPLGIITQADLSGTDLTKNTRAENQQILFEKLFNTDEQLIHEYNFISRNKVVDNENSKSSYSFKRLEDTEDTTFDYILDIKNEQTIYFDCFDKLSNALTEHINGTFDIKVNGYTVQSDYPSKSFNGLLKLGTFENETVTIKLTIKHDLDAKSFGVFGLDKALLDSKLSEVKTANIKEDGSELKGSIQASEGDKCVLSIPYNDGLTVKVNGKEVKYDRPFADLISFDLNDGNNDIEISFTSKGFIPGLVISLIGIALTVLYAVKIKKLEASKELIVVSSVLLQLAGLITLIVVYAVPCLINMYVKE
ncbi:MAG: YfhO family protein [Ruminococcus sp.]|nr:YfhO family protein [Ruminococcus sp.]